MHLVTRSSYANNALMYDAKSGEYIYFHEGKEIWREQGDSALYDYFTNLRRTRKLIDEKVVDSFPIYKKYSDSCQKFNLELMKKLFSTTFRIAYDK